MSNRHEPLGELTGLCPTSLNPMPIINSLLFAYARMLGAGLFPYLLLALILGTSATNSNAKTPTSERYDFPVRYSVKPFPTWFRPLPVEVDSDFHKGQDRYLSRQMALQVDGQGLIHEVHHAVLELWSPDHPWLKESQTVLNEIDLDSAGQVIELHVLKIHRGKQVIDHTQRARPKFVRHDEWAAWVPQAMTLKTVEFRLPKLRPGDRIEFAYSRKTVETFLPSSGFQSAWQVSSGDERSYPVVLERKLFQWDARLPHRAVEFLKDDRDNSLSKQWVRETTEANGWPQVSWTALRVPPAPKEPMTAWVLPNDWLSHDMVGITTRDVGQDAAVEFVKPYLAAGTPLSAAYNALLEQLRREPTPAKQVSAALGWVQANIAFHLDRRPTPMLADEVLAVGKGDCKDVSMLLLQLMRSLGIEAQVAFLSSLMGRLPSRLGTEADFDHVVVVVWIEGKPYVLDGTLNTQPSPLDRMGNLYANLDLRIADGPRAGYLRIPPSANIEDRTRRIDQRTEVANDGESLTVTTSLTFSGVMADYWRGLYASESEEGRRRLFINQMKDMSPKDKWLEPLKIDDDVGGNRLTLRARTQYGVKLRKSPEGHFLIGFGVQPFFDLITDPSGSETRVTPLRMPFDLEQRAFAHHTLVLPKGWKVYETPRSETVALSSMRVNYARKSEAKADGTEVIDTLELNLFSDRVLPADFPAYKAAVDKVVRLTGDIRFGP